jgi:hypothetical protein
MIPSARSSAGARFSLFDQAQRTSLRQQWSEATYRDTHFRSAFSVLAAVKTRTQMAELRFTCDAYLSDGVSEAGG